MLTTFATRAAGRGATTRAGRARTAVFGGALAIALAGSALTAGTASAAPLTNGDVGFAATSSTASTTSTASKAAKGTLGWGIKQSFRNYIEGPIAEGHIDVKKPAKRAADGTFTYGKGKGAIDVDADTANIAFKGLVHFWGHDGALEVWISTPRVVLDGSDTGALVVNAKSRSQETGEVIIYRNVTIATLDVKGLDLRATKKGVVIVNDIEPTLTAEGVPVFAGFYPAGSFLDPISFSVKAK